MSTGLTVLGLGGTAITSAGMAELAALDRLEYLGLQHTSVDNQAVPALLRLRRLTMLDLSGSRVSGSGLLELIDGLPECELTADILDLGEAQIDASGKGRIRWQRLVERMAALVPAGRLKLLDLAGTDISDEQLPDLYDLDGVEAIDLRRSRVTYAGAERLRRELPGCAVFIDVE
jgi:hypothetical protein